MSKEKNYRDWYERKGKEILHYRAMMMGALVITGLALISIKQKEGFELIGSIVAVLGIISAGIFFGKWNKTRKK